LPDKKSGEREEVMVAEAGALSDRVILSDEEFDKPRVWAESAQAINERLPQGLAQRIEDALRPTIPPILDALAEDAKKNAEGLPNFANKNQSIANLVTAISNTLAALTGLAIWATIQESPAWWAKALVAPAALLSAVLGFLPGIYSWRETAAEARRLASEYGHLYGDLLEVEWQFMEGKEDQKAHERIKELRTTLESLKKQRQDINAEW
jgi:hypothetical protein